MNNKWLIYILILVILIIAYKLNLKNNKKKAKKGEYSSENQYNNISAMKHDIFKQITTDFVPIMILNLSLSYDNDIEMLTEKIILSFIGFLIYYQLIQPYIINEIPLF